jgi:hypothetical protein
MAIRIPPMASGSPEKIMVIVKKKVPMHSINSLFLIPVNYTPLIFP